MKRLPHQMQLRKPGRRNGQRAWARLDNAANIFIATMGDLDTKVFRFGVELADDVDRELLQQALDHVYDRYPLYHSVMRRGFFWYYLEESDLRPLAQPDRLVPYEHLYRFDRRELLFRVVYHRRRLSLEVFHALSDGTGAWWFFRDLVSAYLRLRAGTPMSEEGPLPGASLRDDSFPEYFGGRGKGEERTAEPSEPEGERPKQKLFGSAGESKVLRIKGTVTPDRRTRLVEITLPADQALLIARSQGISLTIHLVALFFEAVRRTNPDEIRKRPRVAITVPVNLRAQFPSESARNFFSVTRLEHTYGVGDDSVGAVAASLKEQIAPQLAKDSLQAQVDQLLDMERHPIARFVPRVVKDAILDVVNRINERSLTIAMTGLGKLAFPDDVDAEARELHLSVSSLRPQIAVVTHANWLTLGFTTPYVEMDLVSSFVEVLREQGLPVTINVTKVTTEEMAEATDAVR